MGSSSFMIGLEKFERSIYIKALNSLPRLLSLKNKLVNYLKSIKKMTNTCSPTMEKIS